MKDPKAEAVDSTEAARPSRGADLRLLRGGGEGCNGR